MEERDRTSSFLGHLGKYSNPLLMFPVAVTQSGKRVELLLDDYCHLVAIGDLVPLGVFHPK